MGEEGASYELQRDQFLTVMSHELRTPLTSILSFCELLRGEDDNFSEEGRSFLDIIERNAARLLRLVGDMLMLDRLEAGALPLETEPVDIPSILAEVIAAASADAAKQDVMLRLSTDGGRAVRGDYNRLVQVFANLIGNAVKFSHVGGAVEVTAACDGDTWRIDVTDSGIGIPAEDLPSLFTRFARASNARTAGLPGTGLGLSIVRVLAELHGGRVDVISVLEKGTTFSVRLPVMRP
ncbi:MAG TPA: HAMP domain-containing sensor histidine kinase [Trebonia sp.]|jgi:signal transduction histidine kinase|nr:HAMP domain-containing sensor histidine kinase [Trebonia sp.]